MKRILTVLLLFGAILLGLSYYKNDLLAKQIDTALTAEGLSHQEVSCDGFVESSCTIDDPTYKGHKIADRLIIASIDPQTLVSLQKAQQNHTYENVPLHLSLIGIKDSLWGLIAKKGDRLTRQFISPYTQEYNLTASLTLRTDTQTVQSLQIKNLKAEEKLIPYEIKGQIDNLDKATSLSALQIHLDLSQKRKLFDDFVTQMRSCCAQNFPREFQTMNNDQLYQIFLNKLSQFDSPMTPLNEVINVMKDPTKKALIVSLKAKQKIALRELALPLLMLGPNALERYYDIRVKAE